MSTTSSTSTPPISDGGVAIFQAPGLNSSFTLTVAPSMASGGVDHSLSYDATLADIDITVDQARSCFKFQTDSSDFTELDNEFTAVTSTTDWPSLDLYTRTVTANMINSSETVNLLQTDMPRHIAYSITGGYDGGDIFSNETSIRGEITGDAENNLQSDIRTAISNANGKTTADTGTDNIVGGLLEVLHNSTDGQDRLINYMRDTEPDDTANGVATFSIPFIVGDKIRFTVSYVSPNAAIGNGSFPIATRSYLVTLVVT
tara:strand:+ start:458 stop:1234 length:777 start_codon:yes stop_codon:yes gene_type:complete